MEVYRYLLWLSIVYLLIYRGNAERPYKSPISLNAQPLRPTTNEEVPSLNNWSSPPENDNAKTPAKHILARSEINSEKTGIVKHQLTNSGDTNTIHKDTMIPQEIANDLIQRERRSVGHIGLFAIQTVGAFIANKAMDKIVSFIFGDSNDAISELSALNERLDETESKLDQMSHLLWRQYIQSSQSQFAPRIKILATTVENEANCLQKDSPSPERRHDIINKVLDPILGVEHALDNLDLTIRGEISYDGKSLFEIYYERLIQDIDHKNLDPVYNLREKMFNFVKYHGDLREIGYTIWCTALSAKYANSLTSLNSYLDIVKKKQTRHMTEQKQFVDQLFPDCDKLDMPDYPNRPPSLNCSQAYGFGSVCEQRCSGDKDPYIFGNWHWDGKFYPNIGYAPVQCMSRGRWSNNIDGRTKAGCTFDLRVSQPDVVSPPIPYMGRTGSGRSCQSGVCDDRRRHVPFTLSRASPPAHKVFTQCREDNTGYYKKCQHTIEPGNTVSIWGDKKCLKCLSSCSGYYERYFCYTDHNGAYGACIPEIISEHYTRKTVWGEDCRTAPKKSFDGWLWCYTAKSWDWCS